MIGKGGAAGFLGKAYDPYRLYQDPAKPLQIDDLSLRKDIPPDRLKDRFRKMRKPARCKRALPNPGKSGDRIGFGYAVARTKFLIRIGLYTQTRAAHGGSITSLVICAR